MRDLPGSGCQEIPVSLLRGHARAREIVVTGLYSRDTPRLARCFKERGNWLAAQAMYQQVLAFDPGNQIASNQLVAVNEKLEALHDIELVSEIDDHREAQSIGVAARKQGNALLAIAALRRAVQLVATPYTLTALGAAYRLNGQLDEAERSYRRAITMEGSPAARVGLAAVYAERGRLTESDALYRSVIREDERNIYALNGLGALLVKRGRLEQAEACFIRAAQIGQATDDSVARLTDLHSAYSRKGDSAGAQRIQAFLARLRHSGRPVRS